MNEELRQKIVDRALKDKEPLSEIAKSLFISEHQLKLLFKAWGVELDRKRKYNKVDRPQREELMVKYSEAGTTPALAKEYGVGINTVNRWMKELGIPTKKLTSLKGDDEKVKFLEAHLSKLNVE